MLDQAAKVLGEKDLPVPPPLIKNLPKDLNAIMFGHFERPLYPATTERSQRNIPRSSLATFFGPKCSQNVRCMFAK